MQEVLLGWRFLKIFGRVLIVSEKIGVIAVKEQYLSDVLKGG